MKTTTRQRKKLFLKKWRKNAYQASSMSCGLCQDTGDTEVLVGFDMHARNGDPFAHGHMDIETAETMAAELAAAIAEGKVKRGGMIH